MTDASFAKLVPGFEFLQDLVKNAGSALPSIGQWVAPTLDPEELEKRIDELRTVQFWLEQNARMLAATIQALEVQRMTLSTLKTMNVQMTDLRESMKIKLPEQARSAAEASEPEPPAAKKPARKAAAKKAGAPAAAAGSVVDPMQWWGALTKQFTTLATEALKDGAAGAAKNLAGTVVKQSFDAAGETVRNASGTPSRGAKAAAGGGARKRSAPK
jgi:hypothetical protein